ncbi:MAG: Do family serine endopeptidase, partial [Simkaniaceae bacterium]|nr:Do family serine endopeptidase [Simkaniaceae bacterium]
MKKFAIMLMTVAAFCATQPNTDVEKGLAIARQMSKAFAETAKMATPGSVYITCESEPPAEEQNDGDMFGDDFFNHFFGMPRHPRGKPQPRVAQGSGFVVRSDGYIMTNYHVVQNATKIKVTLNSDKQTEHAATFIGGDPQTDPAVIKLDSPPENLHVLEFADSDAIEVGEWVLAIGSPFGLESSVTAGIVSAKGRKGLNISELENFIQTDASINPGNSGGALVTLDAKVIGINTVIMTASGGSLGIGFAVPSNMAKYVMDQIIETGTVTRGYIGILTQPLDKNLAEEFGLKKPEGALVTDVIAGSPGDKAGLKQGDVILEIDGTPIKSYEQVRNEVMLQKPGSKVKIKVLRGGKTQIITITLGSHVSDHVVTQETTKTLGISVEDLTPQIISKYRLKNDEKGVLITEVKANTIAAKAGIKP